MITVEQMLAELDTASLVTISICGSDGLENWRSEFRGNGIKRLIEMFHSCKCDEHAVSNGRSGEARTVAAVREDSR